MSDVKKAVIEIIDKLPDNSSFDEILRELAFARMIQRGLEDSDEGRTISTEELERRIGNWPK